MASAGSALLPALASLQCTTSQPLAAHGEQHRSRLFDYTELVQHSEKASGVG